MIEYAVASQAAVFLKGDTKPTHNNLNSMTPPSYLVGTAAVTENLLKRKWSAIVLRHLASGISDPAEILRREPELVTKAMNERLRNLLRFCLITRYPSSTNAKQVEYRLTARGDKILKILNFIDQLDEDAAQQDHKTEERTLVTIRRTKITADAQKRILLKT